MPFIIDGHNLLYSIREAEDGFSISDIQLCRILDMYFKQTGEVGEIIFDGVGPKDKSDFYKINNLEVLFAGFSKDTDTIIEEKIEVNTAPRRLTIVSSDRRLRKAARTRRANTVKSEEFWTNVNKQLRRKKTPKEPTAKRQGLSESETDQWLEFFGLE
jgi:predicted RNA-binding protein with PIN domain